MGSRALFEGKTVILFALYVATIAFAILLLGLSFAQVTPRNYSKGDCILMVSIYVQFIFNILFILLFNDCNKVIYHMHHSQLNKSSMMEGHQQGSAHGTHLTQQQELLPILFPSFYLLV